MKECLLVLTVRKEAKSHLEMLCRWQSRLAHEAVQLVGKEDEDDLYFESGQHSQDFLKLLV